MMTSPNAAALAKNNNLNSKNFDELYGKHAHRLCCSKCSSSPTDEKPIIRKDGSIKGIYRRFKCKICLKTFSESDILTKLMEIEKNSTQTSKDGPKKRNDGNLSFLENDLKRFKHHENSFIADQAFEDSDFALHDDTMQELDDNFTIPKEPISSSLSETKTTSIDTRLGMLEKNFSNMNQTIANLSNQMIRNEAKNDKFEILFEMVLKIQQRLEDTSYSGITKKKIEDFRPGDKRNQDSEIDTNMEHDQPHRGKRQEAIDDFVKHCTVRGVRNNEPIQFQKQAEADHNLRLIYVGGISFMQIRTLKDKLFQLRFLLSKIRNIRWIGRSILEFLIDEEYSTSFIDRLKEFNGYVRFLPSFDIFQSPRPNQRESEIDEAQERAIRGIVLQRDKSNDQSVHNFFDQIIKDLGPKAVEKAKKYAAPSKISEAANLISTLDRDHIPVINELSLAMATDNIADLESQAQSDWLHESLKTMTMIEDFNNALLNQNQTSMETLIRQADIDFRITKIAAYLAIKNLQITDENFTELANKFSYGFTLREDYIKPFIEEWAKLADDTNQQAVILLKLFSLDEIFDILDKTEHDGHNENGKDE